MFCGKSLPRNNAFLLKCEGMTVIFLALKEILECINVQTEMIRFDRREREKREAFQ